MVIYISLIAAFVVRNKLKRSYKFIAAMLFSALGSTALLIGSFSRSALGGATLAVGVVASQAVHMTKRTIAVLGGLAVLAAVLVYALSSTDFYSNVVLHEDPESTVQKKSNSEHVKSLLSGTKRVVSEPFGAGVGSTGSASLYDDAPGPTIENQYLFVAHEAGWLGLVVFVGLFILALKRLWAMRSAWLGLGLLASGIGLAAIGLLLPVWVDETVALTWWGLVGVIIGGRYDFNKSK